ncbi:MAG: NAD(P)/FAD-dependent oxidoreductase [Saprospiraceae bacterium]|nr:NAD(P)/FAD-dependent oxidoreductase [Saprospiraceae bacterium]
MAFNIPYSEKKRVVIIGAGFGGFILAQQLRCKYFQIVLIDKNNYHQFQPLFYQVAMSGLEPSSICFPIRKNFRNDENIFIRIAEVTNINPTDKKLISNIGELDYDFLIIAFGNSTNYFGNENFKKWSIPLKSVSEALYLRNRILEDLEASVLEQDEFIKDVLLDVVIVGGGPTGVELAGSLAEMKRHILPKDYPDLKVELMDIHLIQNGDRLLNNMSVKSSENALKSLQKMGVNVHLNKMVKDISETGVLLSSGEFIKSKKVIWAAGVKANKLLGLPADVYAHDGRIIVNENCEVKGAPDVYCIGDAALFVSESFPSGLPALAPVAIQQATYLAKLLKKKHQKQSLYPFVYFDKGQMATIGRNKAVFDYKQIHVQGFIAWIIWLFVHIYFLVGLRNRIIVFINWFWSYLFYDQALRINIKPYVPEKQE